MHRIERASAICNILYKLWILLPYLCLYNSSPNIGKLENPHSLPAVYSHENIVHEKLPRKNLNIVATCSLNE